MYCLSLVTDTYVKSQDTMYTVRRLQYTTFGVMPLRRLQYFVEGSHVKILLNKDVGERASNGWMDVCLGLSRPSSRRGLNREEAREHACCATRKDEER